MPKDDNGDPFSNGVWPPSISTANELNLQKTYSGNRVHPASGNPYTIGPPTPTHFSKKDSKPTVVPIIISTVPFNFFPNSNYLTTIKQNAALNGSVYPGAKGDSTKHESNKSFFLQTVFPFLLAGCGMVAAGVLLDRASGWLFITEVPEALILVPALLGLKGNLEMTLASRLSTMANLGLMDERRQQFTVWTSNISLIQAQAIVVSIIAATIAIVSGGHYTLPLMTCLLLTAALTASVASFLLASLMVGIAIMARKCNINPDNIATPVAGATGDFTTLSFLILFGTYFYKHKDSFLMFNMLLLSVLLISVIWWAWAASREQVTLQVLKFGWFAVLFAMLISSGGGYVLRHSVGEFPNIALFQPVINGVGGNLVAVQSSKISTYLHQFGKMGVLPANRLITYLNPFRAFAMREEESQHSMILLLMAAPGHMIFVAIIFLVQSGLQFQFMFFAFYLLCAVVQVAILLYICQWLCRVIWLLKCNPDNNSIPLLTAMGDLLGTLLLASAFLANDMLGGGSITSPVLSVSNTTFVSLANPKSISDLLNVTTGSIVSLTHVM